MVNPFLVPKSHYMRKVQLLTFESMRQARSFAGDLDIELMSAQFPEDRRFVPKGFTETKPLRGSTMDVAALPGLKKLPFIGEILQKLYESTDKEFAIYSNVDVGFMPHFYRYVYGLLSEGYDALIINSCWVTPQPATVDKLYLIWSQIGPPRGGFDCFVFRRDCIPKFSFANCCTGAPPFGRIVLVNMRRQAKNMLIVTDSDNSFHLRDKQAWVNKNFNAYKLYNLSQAKKAGMIVRPKSKKRQIIGFPDETKAALVS